MFFPDEKTVARIAKAYPPGTRVRLVSMNDPYTQLPPGLTGTVINVDSIATVHIQWDNGLSLGAVYQEDVIEKIKEDI